MLTTIWINIMLMAFLGHLTELVSEGLQKMFTWLDHRGKLFKRVFVAAVAGLLLFGTAWLAKKLTDFGVPELEIQAVLTPFVPLLAYLFHSQNKAKVGGTP